jgi:hypothetical protein
MSNKSKHGKNRPPAREKYGEGEKDHPDKLHITNEPLRVEANFAPSVIDKYDAANKEAAARETKKDRLEKLALLGLFIYCGLTFWQGWLTKTSIRLSERAWISYTLPANFPLEGTATTPATLQVSNFGKTPAREVRGDIIATELMKGEGPAFDFSVGHPHNSFYAGAIFLGSPVPVSINVQRYGAHTATPISSSELKQDLESQKAYIIFYGEITYKDIFGKQHWTRFCTGSGKAIEGSPDDVLKKCITYNDVDHD